MQRKHALDPFAIGNPPDGEGLIQAAAFAADDDAGENLNPLFVAFHHASVDADGVADLNSATRF